MFTKFGMDVMPRVSTSNHNILTSIFWNR